MTNIGQMQYMEGARKRIENNTQSNSLLTCGCLQIEKYLLVVKSLVVLLAEVKWMLVIGEDEVWSCQNATTSCTNISVELFGFPSTTQSNVKCHCRKFFSCCVSNPNNRTIDIPKIKEKKNGGKRRNECWAHSGILAMGNWRISRLSLSFHA